MDGFASAADIAAAVRSGESSPTAVVEATLDRIESRRDVTNAFVNVLPAEARSRARAVEADLEAGADLPLAGVPVAIKDLSETKAGVPNTMGLRPFSDNVAERTSVTVRRLEAAGAIVVGTTNTPELGHRVRTDNLLCGPTATPFETGRNAGGSSGGSAAALADGLCALATGSDVGGSLRNPAACCGVVSIKPSHGLIPRGNRINGFRGHTPVGTLGPIARDVESLAIGLEVMAGADPIDPFSVPTPASYRPAASGAPAPEEVSIAYTPDLDAFAVDPAVRTAIEATLSELEAAGATVEEVSIETPEKTALTRAYLTTATTYFATAVAEIDEAFGIDLLADHREELPKRLRSLVSVGERNDITAYTHSDFPRTELYHAVETARSGHDAVACPALATPPLTHEEPFPTTIDGEPTEGLPSDWTLAWPFNLSGHPVLTVPAGTAEGLPVGMQLVGATYDETTLFRVGAAIEAVSQWTYPDA
jgi:Asp-tRNA(Asn)/Glu-tRNA(Gln) amidotransferase A subunit family amidase